MDKKVYGALEKLMEETMKGAGAIKGDKGDPGAPGKDGLPGNDGVGILSIEKTSTNGLVDTYTITFDDGGTTTFHVTNGKDGKDGEGGSGGAVTEEQIESVVNKYLTENPMDKIVNPLYDASGFTKSSVDITEDMGIGYNIGDYLEAFNSRYWEYTMPENIIDKSLFTETMWGNVPVTEKFIKYLSDDLGIGAIRLPVTWATFVDSNNGLIDRKWLSRVEEIVNMIIKNGMYCIINIHHDGIFKSGWKDWNWMRLEDESIQRTTSFACNTWRQIAHHFRDYGYKLIFETFNEVTDSTGSMSVSDKKTDLANKLNQAIIDVIRETGSNNENRFIGCATYGGVSFNSKIETLIDSANDKLLLCSHDYPTGNSGQVNSLLVYKNKGIGAYLGEIGWNPDNANYMDAIRHLHSYVEANKVACFWWDNGLRDFSIINRKYCQSSRKAALEAYIGKTLEEKTFSYSEIANGCEPYIAKFYTEDFSGVYGAKYIVIASSKPITSVEKSTKSVSAGYYQMKGMENGNVTMYESDDDQSYTRTLSLIATNFAQIRDDFHIFGSTEKTYFVEGNYEITDVPTAPQEPVSCTGITLNSSSLSFDSLATQTLVATVEPENTTDTVVWSTNDSTIATVENGVVTPIKNGTTNITATCGEYSATCEVTISVPSLIECTGINLDNETLEFTDTTTQTLTATVTPSDCTQTVVWNSSDETVATVLNGVVTPIKTGTTTITATCGSQSATCSINVSLETHDGEKTVTYQINKSGVDKEAGIINLLVPGDITNQDLSKGFNAAIELDVEVSNGSELTEADFKNATNTGKIEPVKYRPNWETVEDGRWTNIVISEDGTGASGHFSGSKMSDGITISDFQYLFYTKIRYMTYSITGTITITLND